MKKRFFSIVIFEFLIIFLVTGVVTTSVNPKSVTSPFLWNIEIVDSDNGNYSSLAFDDSGFPHISYYDDDNSDLKHAYQDVSGWHTETVDNAGDVDRTSLAFDDNDFPHIS